MGRLYRSDKGVIAGVCAGVAEFFGWDVATVRLVWFFLAILGVGAPVLFYLILSIVMPAENQAVRFEERMNKRLGK